eukprot:CAMPEP_0176344750 /NCGR_PEP_ID=MMETSP0126-20121128/4922_1 /TAXON_ID=141414 ORGANISM="Strombidinopsis acuminatum, Strain SPMC142" /NCGR_SAMPLE_ID=MMETSP0126 /ASSEMBLY_ACC=CAM_ASM_000229 /LENGTH=65 /DNA_ID=CAMNT_0017691343 /DNA_START=2131 /DNA_END=2328 /DNA_ORIENTATION=+
MPQNAPLDFNRNPNQMFQAEIDDGLNRSSTIGTGKKKKKKKKKVGMNNNNMMIEDSSNNILENSN